MRFVTNFKGFSGCSIQLYSDNGGYFVRKISKSIEYNDRLKKQMLKQDYFNKKLANGKIVAPEILKEGTMNSLFFFDMEYVNGTNLIEYIYDADINELLEISKDLCLIINLMKSQEDNENINPAHIMDKIESVRSSLNNEINQDIFNDLKDKASLMKKYNNIKKTFCHGDLTMENIIYDKADKKYYLIDFLDSFIEHYWFDISKLFQDIEGKWYKFRNPKIDLNNILPKMNFINGFIRGNLLENEDIYKKNHNFFLSLNFARILPYAEEKERGYLVSMIKESIEKSKASLI